MSTLAYGWVERCSDVAGCGWILHQKISAVVYFISVIYTDVKCWNVYVCFHWLFGGLCILVWWIMPVVWVLISALISSDLSSWVVCPVVLMFVASSSPVGGMGTWHYPNRKKSNNNIHTVQDEMTVGELARTMPNKCSIGESPSWLSDFHGGSRRYG